MALGNTPFLDWIFRQRVMSSALYQTLSVSIWQRFSIYVCTGMPKQKHVNERAANHKANSCLLRSIPGFSRYDLWLCKSVRRSSGISVCVVNKGRSARCEPQDVLPQNFLKSSTVNHLIISNLNLTAALIMMFGHMSAPQELKNTKASRYVSGAAEAVNREQWDGEQWSGSYSSDSALCSTRYTRLSSDHTSTGSLYMTIGFKKGNEMLSITI
ncbi:hypothetical protein BJ912DRAFT_1046723 [Pholiota molesta]|nr:hypothetical protein BJ912DRAFT_1046723 [Pholiota molesta]